MTAQAVRPRGRRPGHDDTRGTIREVAIRQFEQQGYDATSLRGIAREADVDPALIHHYFDTKAQLFTALFLDIPSASFEAIVEVAASAEASDRAHCVTREILKLESDPHAAASVESCVDPMAAPQRRRAFEQYLAREVFAKIASLSGHRNAQFRGQLATGAVLGILWCRRNQNLALLASTSDRRLTGPLAGTLRQLLVDSW